ncbi:MAG: SUF system FeS assembly protein, nitrogen fixation protein NifU [Candidatus Peregrinibacteria bacterium GW2011_GWE2_39_6]|nr:MAG: SUF system FeS assembly protein, nitrogen fixation protein NifU [Candidatus Peregrinibacteria bacterium GW2011_GWF2_39_17]KKR26430.1 MAG: SUF system FeS assembly protein, nitrogen fixation protein NifU [Candidatus Peregrinibacteria bacterium GW2011_GWE2_39_6]HCW32182.1 Fe-S cluster protein [Candidatus Peregrinibacteria bacterium]
MDLYREQIIDLAKNPLNRGELANATVKFSGVNTTCGDYVRLYFKIEGKGEKARITDVGWQGEGCVISVAAVSLLTEELKGKYVKEVEKIPQKKIFDLLGVELGPARVKCGTLCLETAKQAMTSFLT